MNRFNFTDLKRRVSWGSVFGGVMTVLAISILLSLLSSAIGLYMFSPLSDHPTSGIGTSIGIWTAIALIVSMIMGGFIAGKLAGVDGMIHGFLVWATTLIAAAILGIMITIGAAKLTMNILGSVTSLVGNVASGVGSVAGSGISALSDKAEDLFGNIDFTTDSNDNQIPANVRKILTQSGVKELQPDYLQKQMQEVKTDLEKSVKKIVANPEDADNIINAFLNRLQKRADHITDNVDRNDLAKAIANNTNMTKAEANETIDQYMDIMNKATDEAKEQIENLRQSLQQAAQEWKEMKHQALVAADEATDAAARSALISFFAILIAAILASMAGAYGSRKTQERVEI